MATGGTRVERVVGLLSGIAMAALAALAVAASAAGPAPAPVDGGGADAIVRPLTSAAADPERGRAIAFGRDGNCLLCHPLAGAGRPTGNLAPPLDGVGARLDIGQLRQRVVNPSLFNPDTIMPSYSAVDGLRQVAEPWRGRPVLDGQQIEDLVAWLQSLR